MCVYLSLYVNVTTRMAITKKIVYTYLLTSAISKFMPIVFVILYLTNLVPRRQTLEKEQKFASYKHYYTSQLLCLVMFLQQIFEY